MHVLIIGAGTGGLALAHGLKQAGVKVSVFERDRTPRNSPGGYRVGISPAGSRALKACVPPALYELFVATCSRAPRFFSALTEQLSELVCLELTGEAADPVDGEKNVIRTILRQVLLTGLEGNVSFDKKFVRYEHDTNGTVRAFFEDGTHCEGDVLIGADGAGSRVRKQRLPYARHEDTGIVSIGGRLALTTESKALLSPKMFNGMSMIMAPKGYGAIIHVLEFAWNRPGATPPTQATDPGRLALWQELIAENSHDYISWGLWASHKHFPSDPKHLAGPELIAVAQEMARDWHPDLRRLIQLTDPTSAQCIKIRTSVPLAPWESSNVTLLGDAIHTMTPGRGAGANTALRDANLLRNVLTEVAAGRKPLVGAIHEYEAEMLRYSTEAVLKSRKQMDANDLIHKPFVGRVQLGVMRVFMRIINAVPAFKRRVAASILRVRAAN
jgi:2-polyprenyl-6-methoxyphenol hydroxylase-like FAD-dependent oxidoreductase